MSAFTDLIKDIARELDSNIMQGLVCKIVSYDKSLMRADVQPILQSVDVDTGQGVDYPILMDLPVLYINAGSFFLRPKYEIDDLVWVGFSAHSIDNPLLEQSLPESESTHSLNDASVICGLQSDVATPPVPFATETEAIMGKAGAYIIFEDNAIKIKIGLTTVIEFSAAGVKATIAGASVTLNTHLHATGVGPSGPPTPGT
jgi:hypothetical protein